MGKIKCGFHWTKDQQHPTILNFFRACILLILTIQDQTIVSQSHLMTILWDKLLMWVQQIYRDACSWPTKNCVLSTSDQWNQPEHQDSRQIGWYLKEFLFPWINLDISNNYLWKLCFSFLLVPWVPLLGEILKLRKYNTLITKWATTLTKTFLLRLQHGYMVTFNFFVLTPQEVPNS